jgi:hypothetical protein
MGTQYRCKNEGRRNAIKEQVVPIINGIDYLEVESGQKKLKVHFFFDLPGSANPIPPGAQKLTRENVRIEGGVRIRDIRVLDVDSIDNVLIVKLDSSGDYSTYTLGLTRSQTDLNIPDGFDIQLSRIEFSFKVDCPSEFDCRQDIECQPENFEEPQINYLARDYSSFRRLMLDRLSVIMPDWKEKNPADMMVVLVELLSYKADHLSYYQDAVATEAYLGTSRKKISVRRHVRMLDYFMHDGCNARTWIHFEVERGSSLDGAILQEATKLLTKGSDEKPVVGPEKLTEIIRNEDPVVFETMDPLRLDSYHNEMRFYTWNDSECCLSRGSTHATLIDDNLSIKIGDILLFEEVVSPSTGKEEDADLSHRHVVRLKKVEKVKDHLNNTSVVEIEWHEEDALPIPFCISALIEDKSGTNVISDMTVARGNIVLADHGRTIEKEPLLPDVVPENIRYRPHLSKTPLTYSAPKSDPERSASSAMNWNVRYARPAIFLGDNEWKPQYDLLASDKFSHEFVVETESDGTSYLRFGDGIRGRRPPAGTIFNATYRIGNGRTGNVGARVITRAVLKEKGIRKVVNPFAATGGTEPEPVEEIKLFAPHAFRTQERAVTEADYAEMAQRHQEVSRAIATIRWTGSWHTAFITIDRKGGRPVDQIFRDEMLSFLERYRLAGYDIEINAPIFVPVDILMKVCVKPGYFRSNVKQALLLAFSNREKPDGVRGYFHPDNFTFKQPLFLSNIYGAAMEIQGVASVEVTKFQRWGKLADNELENGVIITQRLEIIQLDNNPNFPENGKIDFEIIGGI